MSDEESCHSVEEEQCEETSSFEKGSRVEGVVKYGNVIVLRHSATGRFLASDEDCYEAGSGQQRIFSAGDEHEWLVLPIDDSEEQLGYEVGFDDQFKLQHVSTCRHLHSHPDIESPITGQQEVTCFGGEGETDENDIWKLEAIPDYEYPCEDYLWHTDIPLLIRHVSTGRTLHSHEQEFGDHFEVTGYWELDENDHWCAC